MKQLLLLTRKIAHSAILLMAVSTFLLSLMHGLIRSIGGDVHPFQIAAIRSVFGLVVLLPFLSIYGYKPLRAKKYGLLMLRAAINLISMLSFIAALALIPIADATALGFTVPIFLTAIVAITSDVVKPWRWACIAIALLGALLVVRPTFSTVTWGHLFALVAAAAWAVSMLLIKMLGRHETSLTVTIYMGVMMAPLSAILAAFVWVTPNGQQWSYLVLIGVLGGLGHWAIAESLRIGVTSSVMTVDYLKLAWAGLIGWLLLGEPPSAFTILGGTVIISVALYISRRDKEDSETTAETMS